MKTVRELMKNKTAIWSVTPDQSVLDAIKLMAEKDIGAVLVVEGDSLKGILSEKDYARKVILVDKSSGTTPVSEIMTTNVFTVNMKDTVEHCMGIMAEYHIRHLPVVENDKLLGMLSIGDIVEAIITDQKQVIDQLESYINS